MHRNFLALFWVLCLFFFLASVQAQHSSTYNSSDYKGVDIIHNPHAPTDFWVRVFVDRDSSGTGSARYRINDMLYVRVTPSQTAYVYLFVVDASGVVTQLLPNRFDGHGNNNHVQAGTTVSFPPQGADYGYRITGPQGTDKIFVLASREPLTSSTLTGFRYEGAFAKSYGGEALFGDRVLRSVRPLQQNGWVTDSVHYQVVP